MYEILQEYILFMKLKMASFDTQENERIHHRCIFHLIRAVWKLNIEVYALNPSSWKTLITLTELTGGKELYSWLGSALFGGGSPCSCSEISECKF